MEWSHHRHNAGSRLHTITLRVLEECGCKKESNRVTLNEDRCLTGGHLIKLWAENHGSATLEASDTVFGRHTYPRVT